MSYNEDTVRGQLNSLTDAQDSIQGISQWFLFHRRHAARSATFWAQYLQNANTTKRLALIYLVNEIVQQSNMKNKPDFADAFTPVIAQAMATTYAGASRDVQNKLRRLPGLWTARSVFPPPAIAEIASRLDDADKTRPAKRSILGGSLADASAAAANAIPEALANLASLYSSSTGAATVAADAAQSALTAAERTPASVPPPELPSHSAALSKTLRELDSAAASVRSSLTARAAVLAELNALIASTSAAQEADETRAANLKRTTEELDSRKRTAEDAIVAQGITRPETDDHEPARPEIEALTPPRAELEAFTPPPDLNPAGDEIGDGDNNGNGGTTPPGDPSPYARSFTSPPPRPSQEPKAESRDPRRRPASTAPAPPAKKRKVVEEDSYGGTGMEGLDEEVVGLLGA